MSGIEAGVLESTDEAMWSLLSDYSPAEKRGQFQLIAALDRM